MRRLEWIWITPLTTTATMIAFLVGGCDSGVTDPDVTVPGLLSAFGSEPQVVLPTTAPAGGEVTVVVNTLPHSRNGHRICISHRVETRTTLRGMQVEIRPLDGGPRLPDDEECFWPDPNAVIVHVATFEAPGPGTVRVRVMGEEMLTDGRIRPLTVEHAMAVTSSDPVD